MNTPALHKLLTEFHCLESGDLDIFDGLFENSERHDVGHQMLAQGSAFERITVINSGWAMRYKVLADGRRQILNFMLPGDIYGMFSILFESSEFGVEALTQVETSSFSSNKMLDAFNSNPRLGLALCWLAGIDERQLDEQILRIGKRNAGERMAHLFIELYHRQRTVGIGDLESRCLPLTQPILADSLGMSHVHANRCFRQLVRDGLVELESTGIMLLDINSLKELTGFDREYLDTDTVPDETIRQIDDIGL